MTRESSEHNRTDGRISRAGVAASHLEGQSSDDVLLIELLGSLTSGRLMGFYMGTEAL
jgi:hypothetical protein